MALFVEPAAMPNTDPTESQARDEVLSQLRGCGIAESRVSLEYADAHQDFIVTVSGAGFSDTQLECVVKMALKTGYFTNFPDKAARERFLPMWGEASRRQSVDDARQWLQDQGKLGSLPLFDPAKGSLSSYAQQLEAFCGVAPKLGLTVYNDTTLTPNIPDLDKLNDWPISDEQFTCLMNAATGSNLHEHGIFFGFIGNAA
jgi:hypothetical protein